MRFDSAAMLLPLCLFNLAAQFLNAYRVFNSAALSFKSATASLAWPIFCLNFALLLFSFPFGFQITVIRNLSDPSLIVSRDFVEAAL